MLIRIITMLVLALSPRLAEAQPAWDVAGTVGLFAGYTPRTEGGTGYQELWFQNVQAGISVGRYLSPQLKLEVDAAATNGGTQFRERLVAVPGSPFPYPAGSEVTTEVRSVGSVLTYQFGRNDWVHPFVQAGATLDFDHIRVRTWEQFVYSDSRGGTIPRRVIEERTEEDTTRHVRGLVGAGAKVYFTERGFVRTDARWTFDRTRRNLAVRVGLGIDF